MQSGAEMRSSLAPGGKPAGNGLCGPFGRLLGVALHTDVRRAQPNRQVGARHTQAVIPPRMHNHVGLRRRMAVDALGTRAARFVVVMLAHIETRRQVTLRAERIAFDAQLRAVRIVTV